MNIANPKTSLSVRDQVSKDEWNARVNLAAAYRLVALYGWDDLVFTHISARVPGPEHHFLINPYGWMFGEITASSLVKVDLESRKVMPSDYDINPAGFVIHSAIHAARQDALCVMHTHTPNGVAVSAQKNGLLPISQQRKSRGREVRPVWSQMTPSGHRRADFAVPHNRCHSMCVRVSPAGIEGRHVQFGQPNTA